MRFRTRHRHLLNGAAAGGKPDSCAERSCTPPFAIALFRTVHEHEQHLLQHTCSLGSNVCAAIGPPNSRNTPPYRMARR